MRENWKQLSKQAHMFRFQFSSILAIQQFHIQNLILINGTLQSFLL